MEQTFFQNIYSDLQTPVVVCANAEGLPVAYMNRKASLLFSPAYSLDELAGRAPEAGGQPLGEIVRFRSEESFGAFRQLVHSVGYVDNYQSEVVTFDYTLLPVYISGNSITLHQADDHFVLYLSERREEESGRGADAADQLPHILDAALLAEDVDAALQMVLAVSGELVNVSRAYIFEEVDAETTSNTYEWCADGVETAKAVLQNLKKSQYPYDSIVEAGMFIVNDVRKMPAGMGDLLQPQGIYALALIAFYDGEHPIGYVGFDDCLEPRKWSAFEIRFLKSIAALVATLVKRRNAEALHRREHNLFELILENSDNFVYANTLEDRRLLFVNRKAAETVGRPAGELVGRHCWEVFREGRTGPCPFCPIDKITLRPGDECSDVYEWENHIFGKTFLAKDNIIRWTDGRYVHVGSSTDITARIRYEEQLYYYATTDAMTGVKNREWGEKEIQGMLAAGFAGSLVFVDVDGLKFTNDNYGHISGDDLLKEGVALLKERLQEGDFLCRWGGDEFLLLLKGPEERAEETMAAVQQEMERRNREGGRPFELSVSYGIAAFGPGAPEGLDVLLAAADRRMYQNKREKNAHMRRRCSDQETMGEG